RRRSRSRRPPPQRLRSRLSGRRGLWSATKEILPDRRFELSSRPPETRHPPDDTAIDSASSQTRGYVHPNLLRGGFVSMFHSGERDVQRRAGASEAARRVGAG